MATLAGRPRVYFYIISDNDDLELPRLVTDSVEEVAQFLGTTVSGIYHHFTSGYETAGNRKERYKYKIERYRKEVMN